jgi:hypothetical protein
MSHPFPLAACLRDAFSKKVVHSDVLLKKRQN